MSEHMSPIPSRIYNAAVGGHVAGADQIIDDETGLTLDKVTGGALEEKTYTSGSDNGMGRVVLRKNLVEGVNILTQSMINKSNTTYIIQYDFTIGENITVPANSILEFDGGSISAGSGQNMDTITGTNTGINAGLVKIFDTDITITGSWNVVEAYPEWFGAIGINEITGTESTFFDSSEAFKKVIDFCFINHITLFLPASYYYVTGDNPFGLKYRQVDTPPFVGRDTFSFDINGNSSTIYWDNIEEGDIFSNIGYLRLSEWKNFKILTLNNNDNLFGTIFQSNRIKNQSGNIFSKNKFSNIFISGGCDKVFDFNYTIGAHDDLSVFELIQAELFNVFVNIANSQSVSNLFLKCNIGLNIEGAIGYKIAANAYAGGLTIQDNHFTIIENNCKIIEDTSNSNNYTSNINCINNRTEIFYNAYNWILYDINTVNTYINRDIVIRVQSSENETIQGCYYASVKKANITIQNSSCFFKILIKNGSDVNNNINLINNTFFKYYLSNGKLVIPNIEFESSPLYSQSLTLAPQIHVVTSNATFYKDKNDNTINYCPWPVSYNLNIKGKRGGYEKTILKSVRGTRPNMVDSEVYKCPKDIIIKSIRYYCDNFSNIKQAKMFIDNTEVVYSGNVNNSYIEIVPNRKELLLRQDVLFYFAFFNVNGTQVLEHIVGVTDSRVEITYRHPSLQSDFISFEDPTINIIDIIPIDDSYFDTTLNKPIWWNGTAWVDATGTPV